MEMCSHLTFLTHKWPSVSREHCEVLPLTVHLYYSYILKVC